MLILISNVVFKEHLNICSIRIVNGFSLRELFLFACVCLNDIMLFVSYDKFFAM